MILTTAVVLAALLTGLTLALTSPDAATPDPLPPGMLARGPDAFDALASGGIAHTQVTGFERRNAFLDADAAKGADIPPEQFVQHSWARYDAAGRFREAILATFDAVSGELVRRVRIGPFGDVTTENLVTGDRQTYPQPPGGGTLAEGVRLARERVEARLASGELQREPADDSGDVRLFGVELLPEGEWPRRVRDLEPRRVETQERVTTAFVRLSRQQWAVTDTQRVLLESVEYTYAALADAEWAGVVAAIWPSDPAATRPPQWVCEATEAADAVIDGQPMAHDWTQGDPLPPALLAAINPRWRNAHFDVESVLAEKIVLFAEEPDAADPEVRNLTLHLGYYQDSAGSSFWAIPSQELDVGCRLG